MIFRWHCQKYDGGNGGMEVPEGECEGMRGRVFERKKEKRKESKEWIELAKREQGILKMSCGEVMW